MLLNMRDELIDTRMSPVGRIFNRFSPMLQQLANSYEKPVELIITGSHILIDKTIEEKLYNPLLHLVRNAFDHGIEEPEVRIAQGKSSEGTIWLRAMQRGNKTIIILEDDGKGIDLQKIRDRLCQMGLPKDQVEQMPSEDLLEAIFEPGFSTAEQVTELSGRGVGMDVVRSNLQEVRGDIKVETTPGKGTKFIITVPLSLLILRVTITGCTSSNL